MNDLSLIDFILVFLVYKILFYDWLIKSETKIKNYQIDLL